MVMPKRLHRLSVLCAVMLIAAVSGISASGRTRSAAFGTAMFAVFRAPARSRSKPLSLGATASGFLA